ncbi:MAG TPA: PorV/PorQ family protein [candidate division Zixibacteria bacterium]|nr:PorV/PorQ family protein [candidate division Zixibacteria bacterium]
MKKIIILTVLLTVAFSLNLAAEEADGGYAGAFFQIPIGARPTAMGGAYRGLSDDGAGVLFNPAGLSNINKRIFATSYRAMALDRKMGYATLIFPTSNYAALGIHWLYAGSGGVERRNYDGDPLGDEIEMHNHDFSIIFAKRFESFLSLGIKMNYLASTFADMNVYSIGVDLGAMLYIDHCISRESDFELPVEDLRVGLTVKYLDAKYKWNNEDYILQYVDGQSGVGTEQDDTVPTEIGLGISGRLLNRNLVLATDVVKNTEQSFEIHFGAEYYFRPEVAVRAGVDNGRLTFGAGYVFTFGKQLLGVDYAFSTDKADEGSEHIFSFDLLF